jgi:hypothetical protein
MREFRLHELPWPVDVLAELGDEEVRLRVTLSYFVEPAAASRGWRRRYSYGSHGLRFELKEPSDHSTADFIRRVNREASQEEAHGTITRGSPEWIIGPNQRNTGSLHQDVWVGTGSKLAACNSIAVHAVGGWWKNNRRRDRMDLPVRYSLVVSLRTRQEHVDLYTPVAVELDVPIESAIVEI